MYAGFDAWMKAKELADPKSKIWKIAKGRLGWALKRSGVLKLTPSSTTGQTGWSKDFSYKIRATKDLDWAPRTDFMRGGVYITNIPTGEILLEITPDKGLPTIVQKYNITAGELRKITIPIDQDALQSSVERGEYLPKEDGGNEIMDTYVQDLVQFGSKLLEEFKKTNVTLPSVDVPEGSVVQLTDTDGEHFTYDGKGNQTVKGGQYLVEVSTDGVGSFGDLVIHPDLTTTSVESLFTDAAKRRDTPINPSNPNQIVIELVPIVEVDSPSPVVEEEISETVLTEGMVGPEGDFIVIIFLGWFSFYIDKHTKPISRITH